MQNNNDTSFFFSSMEHLPNPYICLNLLGFDTYKPGQSFVCRRNMFSIYFIRSGKGTLQVDEQIFRLQENDVFLSRPNESVIFTSNDDSSCDIYFFSFSGLFASELINRTVFKNGSSYYSLSSDTLFHHIRQAASGIEKSDCPDIYGIEQLFKFFSNIIAPTDTRVKKASSYTQYVKEVQKYIEQNYSKSIKVAELAKSFNLNRSHFYRIFKEHTGVSVEQFLANTRIEHAKKLLCETELPISSIAELIGYRNYSTFHAMFKKILQISPGEYRELQKSIISESKGNVTFIKQEFSYY